MNEEIKSDKGELTEEEAAKVSGGVYSQSVVTCSNCGTQITFESPAPASVTCPKCGYVTTFKSSGGGK